MNINRGANGGRLEIYRSVRDLSSAERDELAIKLRCLNVYLGIVDILLVGVLESHALKMIDEMKSHGIYRHEYKRCANNLIKNVKRLNLQCRIFEKLDLLYYVTFNIPSMRSMYASDGGGVVDSMQYEWMKRTEDDFMRLYYCCKNARGKHHDKYSSVTAYALVCQCIAVTMEEAGNLLLEENRKYFPHGTEPLKLCTPESVLQCKASIRKIVTLLCGGDTTIEGHDLEVIRNQALIIQRSLHGERMGGPQNIAVEQSVADFCEYCLAKIALMLKSSEGVPAVIINDLKEFIGDEHTESLLFELSGFDFVIGDVRDVMDACEFSAPECDYFRNKLINYGKK